MPPLRTPYIFRHDHQAPQLRNIQHVVVTRSTQLTEQAVTATSEGANYEESLIDVDGKSSDCCQDASMRTASVNQEATPSRTSARLRNRITSAASPLSPSGPTPTSPHNVNVRMSTDTPGQVISTSRANRGHRQSVINRYLSEGQSALFLTKRFHWLKDQPFLNLARAGQLSPIDLMRLIAPRSDDDANQLVPRSNTTTRASAQAFTLFFDSIHLFASAWFAYGEIMGDAAVDARARGMIFNAMSVYLRWLVNWTTTHKWSACMDFHHALHLQRKCMGPFSAVMWLEAVEVSLEIEYFNDRSILPGPGSASASASTSTATTSIDSETEMNHKNARAARSAVMANRRRLAKAADLCGLWNEQTCSRVCRKGLKHICWVCGGAHPGHRCPDDMST